MITAVFSYSSSTPKHEASFARELRQLADVAGAAARDVGIDVRWVNAADPEAAAAELIASVAGVVVLGGADVDPAQYGTVPSGTWMSSTDAAADVFEADLMRSAIDAGKPVLAICRGAQLLNVAYGGTLVQDLGPGIHRGPGPDAPMVTHDVEVRAGTRLAGILGAGVHSIRSGHHQAIDELGAGLAVNAVAADGVVEAVELPGSAWVVGVQWHPEDPEADPAGLRALLEDFRRAAAS